MIENYFRFRPSQAPRKRFRGQKGYYRRILQKARAFSLPLNESDWFDAWHYHADWSGYGNLGWHHRKLHIEALCLVFRNIAFQVTACSTPYQLWIQLNLQDAGQDAVYFHTPNPNSNNFPLNISHATWDFDELELYLLPWLTSFTLSAGIGSYEGNQHFYIYSTTHGQSLR